ncbi:MAG TPA: alanine--tRNA ligase [Candidatus Marinimicrobia bacterium]|nr:alanine--tRNA ligase [Candidatus Neomarinimicrobiota bacterium]
MKSKDIRNSFIEYFKDLNHDFVRSAPVTPINDPSLLFINAGMNQFKPIFLGNEKPLYKRVMNSQKCIRVSGKHNDLEEVGLDTYHHTFFEMLGNWSFGDYYKKEAIDWAWKLLTKEWEIDQSRLWVTVYESDDEAYELWKKVTDIHENKILRFGKKFNFWEMGETGPCGPCSEIHYYIGDDKNNQDPKKVNVSHEYRELWNLVFVEFNRTDRGNLTDLSEKHIDTGAGLERLTSVMQNKKNNYDTDLFIPIIQAIEKETDISSSDNPIPFRVIADHIRMLSVAISDGVLPSNEGRGYVLRRILRRAARFGRQLKFEDPFLSELVEPVCSILGETYPELDDKMSHIQKVLRSEELSFNNTLDRGLVHFDKLLSSLTSDSISGKQSFRLYDTYGFPFDLTQLLAKEKGLYVDEAEFKSEMEKQKTRARGSKKFSINKEKFQWQIISKGKDSHYLGYEFLTSHAEIRKISRNNDKIILILDQTPFYAESGGQIGDIGIISVDDHHLTVEDTIYDTGESIMHICKGTIADDLLINKVECIVDKNHRQAITSNHTATHLLHSALKSVLGDHVHQAGSLVSSNHLRFDLTHNKKINSTQLAKIELLVNQEILKNIPLTVEIKPFETARNEGVEALFGEKYGDEVRVISVGKFSKELCGGTHVNHTGEIGLFKIIEESSLSAGVRRIIAITGKESVIYVQNQSSLVKGLLLKFNCNSDNLISRIDQIIDEKKTIEKKLKQKNQSFEFDIPSLIKKGEEVGSSILISSIIENLSLAELKNIGDSLLQKINSGIGILGSVTEQKPQVVIVVTKDLIKNNILAGAIAKEIGKTMGGGGGGKPYLATSGGKNPDKLKSAIESGEVFAKSLIIKESNGS